MEHATVLEKNILRRWKDDEELASIPLDVKEHFGAPFAVIYRADLQRILLDAAIGCGCKILKGHEVLDSDEKFLPLILVRSRGTETWISADLVLAADGMNSIVRKRMAEASDQVDQLVPTRGSAYRFLLPKELSMRYIGPGIHIMGYPLRNNTLYNVVLVREAENAKCRETSWATQAKKEEILEYCRGWCPVIQALTRYAPSSGILETPMNILPPLPTWVKGQTALAGDACHYMLPYVAQGAANAIEDAGTLAIAFTCTDNIELALGMYQLIRKDRSERIQVNGEEQRRRDDSIRAASRGLGTNPDQWSDRRSREFMWRVDVIAETINKFNSLARGVGINKGG
ncbi:putative salicylate hydroxylase [Xylaria grammica]|nr:putative salicylate hydroxylase [Xylaria grammica]